MLEIIVISIIGVAALAYLIYFFICESKKENMCAGCPYAAGCSRNKKGIKRT